jgi:hypothetical protein
MQDRERSISAPMRYFLERTPIPIGYQVHLGKKDYVDATTGIRVLPFNVCCKERAMP